MTNLMLATDDTELTMVRQSCRDGLPMGIIVSALLIGILLASTTLYLGSLDAAATLLLH